MKTKYIYIGIFLLSCAFLLSSCKKYLDIKPKGRVIPQKIEDFERILNEAYLFRFVSRDIERLTDDFYDPFIQKNQAISDVDGRLYNWLSNVYIEQSELQYSPWYVIYKSVYQFNAIINEAPTSEGATPNRVNRLIAQAKFGRAVCFWYLLNLYAKPYNKATASQDMGIPLVQSNSIEDELPGRGTVQGCYDFIIKDLLEAAANAPESGENSYVITKAAASGFLARAYLMTQEYAKAAAEADEVLKYSSRLINYNEIYQDKTSTDVNVKYTGWNASGSTLFEDNLTFPESVFSLLYDYVGGMSRQTIIPELVNLIDSTTDLRRLYLVPAGYEPPWDGTFTYSENFYYVNPGITTPEMYLVKAEGLARSNQVGEAMTTLNTLRKNRYRTASYSDLTATGEKDAVRKILKERRMELFFKGARWFDLRRFKDDPDYAVVPRHYFNDGTFIELQPNDPAYIFKLPETVLTDKIKQN